MADVKTKYEVGNTVWIYGISNSRENHLTQGKVVKVLDLSSIGYTTGPYYIIAIPTGIEDLLEIRTWETISEDEHGPIGAFRDLQDSVDAIHKTIRQVGYTYDDELAIDEPTPEQIHAAIERSSKANLINPLGQKPKRKYYNKKRKV